MLKKRKLYQQQGKRLVSLYPQDKPSLGDVLRQRLGRYVRLGGREGAGEGAPFH